MADIVGYRDSALLLLLLLLTFLGFDTSYVSILASLIDVIISAGVELPPTTGNGCLRGTGKRHYLLCRVFLLHIWSSI